MYLVCLLVRRYISLNILLNNDQNFIGAISWCILRHFWLVWVAPRCEVKVLARIWQPFNCPLILRLSVFFVFPIMNLGHSYSQTSVSSFILKHNLYTSVTRENPKSQEICNCTWGPKFSSPITFIEAINDSFIPNEIQHRIKLKPIS